MILKSFGCSFIFGTDLHDDGSSKDYAQASQYTWPALLAKDLNCEYHCFARAGAGNLRILEKILNQIQKNDPALYVIGWTWVDRYDYTGISEMAKCNKFECVDNEMWQTIMPVDNAEKAHYYYKHLHSQYRDKLSNLIYIKTAIDTLHQNNIPFIMTYMDDLLFETQWQYTEAVKLLQKEIKPYMTQFDNQNFLNWSKKKGFPISETLHPLEAAHQAAFELIKSYNLV